MGGGSSRLLPKMMRNWQQSDYCLLLGLSNVRHLTWIALTSILTTLSGLIDPIRAVLFGRLFEQFTSYGNSNVSAEEFKTRTAGCLLDLFLLAGLSLPANALSYASWVAFGERRVSHVRLKLLRSMLDVPMECLETEATAESASPARIQSYLHDINAGTSQSLGLLLQALISTIAALGLAMYMAWDLSLMTLLLLPFALVVLRKISNRIRLRVIRKNDEMNKVAQIVRNTLGAIDTVRVFNTEKEEFWKYSSALQSASTHCLRHARLDALRVAFVRLITLVMLLQGLYYGIQLYKWGQRSPKQVLTAFWACLIAVQSISHIMPKMMIIDRARVAASSIRKLMSPQASTPRRRRSGRKPETVIGDIFFESVSFCYRTNPNHQALDGFSFSAPPGRFTFIIGQSGSGKSTVASLILKFYEIDHGKIVLDGISYDDLDETWTRNNVTVVNHDPGIFDDSVLGNVIFDSPSRSVHASEVEEAFNFSGLSEVVEAWPQGRGTRVGRGGVALSGGQCQRIGFARARIRDTPILILDEATSALESRSRDELIYKLRKWRQGKTTIIISHDTTFIESDDYVYHIHDGKLMGEGSWGVLRPSSNNNSNLRQIYTQKFLAADGRRNETQIHSSKSGPEALNIEQLSKAHTHDALLERSRAARVKDEPTTITINESVNRYDMDSRQENDLGSYRSDSLDTVPTLEPLLAEQMRLEEPSSLTWKGRNNSADWGLHRQMTIAEILATIWPSLTTEARMELIVGFTAAFLHALATPAFAYVFARALSAFELPLEKVEAYMSSWTLILIAVTLVDAAATFLMQYGLDSAGQVWIDSMRRMAFRKVLNQPRAWYDIAEGAVDHVVSSLDEFADEMRDILSRLAALAFAAASMIIVAFIWSSYICWRLSTVGILATLVFFVLSRRVERICQYWDERATDASLDCARIFSEVFENIKTVHSMNLEAHFTAYYRKVVHKATSTGSTRGAVCGAFVGFVDGTMIVLKTTIFWYGSTLVLQSSVSVPDIISVFSILVFSLSSVSMMTSMTPQAAAAQEKASRLLYLAQMLTQKAATDSQIDAMDMPRRILFKDVNLAYPTRPTTLALRSLNLEILPGTLTGIVGPSGGGKSTIVRALLGLYPISSARHSMLLGDRAYSEYSLRSLRTMIGYVSQRTALFSDTIAQNIAYGCSTLGVEVDQESIEKGASLAGIHAFIVSLPEGYETRIGAGGLGLSAGQQQRLAIARAFTRQPKLLIMDEPTSNLDEESARHVRNSIRTLVEGGMTAIVVTHSTSMMRATDRLVVVEGGAATENGTWETLINRPSSRLRWVLEAEATLSDTLRNDHEG